jgi:F420-dependent methylenetetrahydromethanopterin dehydrogenase
LCAAVDAVAVVAAVAAVSAAAVAEFAVAAAVHELDFVGCFLNKFKERGARCRVTLLP